MTIIWYSDCTLPPDFAGRVQRELRKAAGSLPIIAVSQKPETFADLNLTVGEIGRSYRNIYWQALVGAQAAESRYVALAEHDCLYHPSHFLWRPPEGEDDTFWYDVNHWQVHFQTGQYGFFLRMPLSMLVCARELFLATVQGQMESDQFGEPGPAKRFWAAMPSLDVRYGGNFSGSVGNWIRKDRKRRETLPYWGRFEDYWADG